MIGEMIIPFRREVGQRQCRPKRGHLTRGLVQNGEGLLGFQEATVVVTVLGTPAG